MTSTDNLSEINDNNEVTQPTPKQPTVSVVMLALSEADGLAQVISLIPEWVNEVIVVVGQSTSSMAATIAPLYKNVRLVKQDGYGKSAALRAGFAAAQGDIIVMLNADGSTDPVEIPLYVGSLLTGADFAKGSRFLQGGGTANMPFYRKLANQALVVLVRMVIGGNFSDLTYSYNAFWKQVVPALELDGDGLEIEAVMNLRALRAGLKIVEVPSYEAHRIQRVRHWRAIPVGWRVIKTIIREGSRAIRSATTSK